MEKASDGLLQSSLVNNSSFMMTDSQRTTDASTAMAALNLFLNAILGTGWCRTRNSIDYRQ